MAEAASPTRTLELSMVGLAASAHPTRVNMAFPVRKPSRPKPPTAKSSARTIDAFTAYVAGECHLAENTVAAYRRDLRRFYKWLDGRNVRACRSANWPITPPGCTAKTPASIARRLVSLKVFFRYLQLEGAIAENVAELLGSQRLWQRVPKTLSPQQIERLFQCPHDGDPYWRRDRAMLELLYATGCRASELSHLRLCDMRLDEGYCICRGKGDKERLVPVGGRAVAAVRAYFEHERGELAARRSPAGKWVLLSSAAFASAASGFGNC